MEGKKVLFSGIQPTGNLTIGNYIGAMKSFIALQDDYQSYFCVVDMHSITVRQEPAALRRQTLDLIALYLAIGLDPQKANLFVQSHVSAHAELAWVLNCYTYFGELSRMTQFKDKSAKHAENINAGLFDYPVLMASDILLYQADIVPIGDDQKQHLELTRDVATRFNNAYSPTFVVPEPYFPKLGARIMSLQEPKSKMSKSDPDESAMVRILEKPADIERKFKRAVTDSQGEVRFDEAEKPGIANLMTIYSAFTGADIPAIEREFSGQGYGAFKSQVAQAVIQGLSPVRDEFERIRSDTGYLESVMRQSAEQAQRAAGKTLAKVYKKIGFVPRPRG